MSRRVRSFTEMSQFDSFEERYDYLRLRSSVGESTFGFDRWINQAFYQSAEWRSSRDKVIVRDNGRDLGVIGHEIYGTRMIIHHMNPIRLEDLDAGDPDMFDPEYLIVVTHDTHNAIHYGDESLLRKNLVERQPGDTKLW